MHSRVSVYLLSPLSRSRAQYLPGRDLENGKNLARATAIGKFGEELRNAKLAAAAGEMAAKFVCGRAGGVRFLGRVPTRVILVSSLKCFFFAFRVAVVLYIGLKKFQILYFFSFF